MTDKELMQMALDTLQGLFGIHSDSGGVAVWRLGGSYEVKEAIDALKARLEQPEDVTEINFGNIPVGRLDLRDVCTGRGHDVQDKRPRRARGAVSMTTEDIIKMAHEAGLICSKANGFDRVNLTPSEVRFANLVKNYVFNEQVDSCLNQIDKAVKAERDGRGVLESLRDVEAKLKEKNT
jgi:hypothetical protein